MCGVGVAGGPVPAARDRGVTSVLVWEPAACELRRRLGSLGPAVVGCGRRALGCEGLRWPIAGGGAGGVDGLVACGRRLNAVVRAAHHGSSDVVGSGELAAVLSDLADAAASCRDSFGPVSVKKGDAVCVGRLSVQVGLVTSGEELGRFREAAAVNGLRMGAWVRDCVAGFFSETGGALSGSGHSAGVGGVLEDRRVVHSTAVFD